METQSPEGLSVTERADSGENYKIKTGNLTKTGDQVQKMSTLQKFYSKLLQHKSKTKDSSKHRYCRNIALVRLVEHHGQMNSNTPPLVEKPKNTVPRQDKNGAITLLKRLTLVQALVTQSPERTLRQNQSWRNSTKSIWGSNHLVLLLIIEVRKPLNLSCCPLSMNLSTVPGTWRRGSAIFHCTDMNGKATCHVP